MLRPRKPYIFAGNNWQFRQYCKARRIYHAIYVSNSECLMGAHVGERIIFTGTWYRRDDSIRIDNLVGLWGLTKVIEQIWPDAHLLRLHRPQAIGKTEI